jgi:hypothetical protein
MASAAAIHPASLRILNQETEGPFNGRASEVGSIKREERKIRERLEKGKPLLKGAQKFRVILEGETLSHTVKIFLLQRLFPLFFQSGIGEGAFFDLCELPITGKFQESK